jgi:hypothetical protein
MGWKTMNKPGEMETSPEELKICELCGTLNYTRNRECFTCGWKGRFNCEKTDIEVAWRRLHNEFEAVRLEHVTARRAPVLGDFGRTQKISLMQRLQARWRLWRRELWRRRGSAVRRSRHDVTQPTEFQNDTIA